MIAFFLAAGMGETGLEWSLPSGHGLGWNSEPSHGKTPFPSKELLSFIHLLIHSFNKHRWGPSLGQALHWVQGRPVVESDVISSNLGWEDGRISR